MMHLKPGAGGEIYRYPGPSERPTSGSEKIMPETLVETKMKKKNPSCPTLGTS